MEHYLTSTELKQNLKRAKELARTGIVHVLENGHAGYVLCSSQVYEDAIRTARAQAAWEAEVREVCRDGLHDKARGNVQTLFGIGVTQTAMQDIALEYDGRAAMDLRQTITRISEDPGYGLSIELQGLPQGMCKVLAPPHELVYMWDEAAGGVLVLGVVSQPGQQGPIGPRR